MPAHISRRAFVGATLALLPSGALAQPGETWATYRNDRFGTTIDYPRRFRPGRPPDNNDGLTFSSPDGATLAVWASLNINSDDRVTLERATREAQAGHEIWSYSARGENWFVFSGRRGPDGIFYKRYLLSHGGDVINAFDLGYPEALKPDYDPIVTRISRSLRPGRGYQVRRNP